MLGGCRGRGELNTKGYEKMWGLVYLESDCDYKGVYHKLLNSLNSVFEISVINP